MSSGGDSIRTCGLAACFRCGMQVLRDQERAARIDLVHQVVALHVGRLRCRSAMIALALLTQMSMPPNSRHGLLDRGLHLLLEADVAERSAAPCRRPPRSPRRPCRWCRAAWDAARRSWRRSAILAPSRAARSAIARPMPRLAPVMNSVLPLSDVIVPPSRCFPPIVLRSLLPRRLRATGTRDRGRRRRVTRKPNSTAPRAARQRRGSTAGSPASRAW